MTQTGEVAKCDTCGSWHLTVSGCRNCESEPSEVRGVSPKEGDTKSDVHCLSISVSASDKDEEREFAEDGKFGRILSLKLLSQIMQKKPTPDRHNTLQFDIAAELLLSSPDCDVRVDLIPMRDGPRAHLW